MPAIGPHYLILPAAVLALIGFSLLTRYSVTPGEDWEAPANWPKESELELDPVRPTLLMFLHPHCPCSRASLEELNRLLSRGPGAINTQLVFVQPEFVTADWQESSLMQAARDITAARGVTDVGGKSARRFGATTSGSVLLYSSNGALLFSGGITAARGHSGDNAGSAAILHALQSNVSAPVHTPVFGCGLFSASLCAGKESAACKR